MRSVVLFLTMVALSFSLTLEQALELAVKNNLSTKLSLIDLQRAEEGIRQARAGILPRVGLSYSYTRLGGELSSLTPPENRHSFLLELNQTVFNRAVFEGISLAKEQRDLQKLVYEDVLRDVQFATKQLFYAVLQKREVLKIAEDNLKYWKENYEQTETKFRAGMVPRVELLRAKAQFERAKARVESTLVDYQKSLEDLRRFLKHDGEVKPEGELTYSTLTQEDYEKLLVENNSTIKVAKKSLEVLQRSVEVQRSQYYPNLNLFVTYQGNSSRVRGEDRIVEGPTIGARLTYNIFDGFSREANLAQARLDLLKQLERLRDTELAVRSELTKTLLEIRSVDVQIRAVKISLEAAKESLRLSSERYRFGIATQLEVLDAINNYNNILEEYYLLLYLYNTALARLERLTR